MDNYRIFTFGGAGSSITNALLLNKFDQDKIFYFDTDSQALQLSPLKNKFQIGQVLTYGKGTNSKIGTAKQAFDDDIDLFKRLIKPDLIYILIGGFGGGFFTGLSSKFSELLYKKDKSFIVVGTLPFSFEEKARMTQSIDIIKELNHYTDKLVLLKNDDLHKSFGNLTIDEIFRRIDNTIVEVIKEITFEIHSSEIINKKAIQLTPNLQDIILQIKLFVKQNDYLISTISSKIIVADTNKELLKALTIDPAYVHKISPRKFEELIDYIYQLSGHKTKLTKATRDDGADLLVWTPPPVLGNKFLTVVQAKRYGKLNKVGSKEIRELIGTRFIFKADKAQIITTSDYTKPAIRTAKSQKIDLLKFYELNDTIKSLID